MAAFLRRFASSPCCCRSLPRLLQVGRSFHRIIAHRQAASHIMPPKRKAAETKIEDDAKTELPKSKRGRKKEPIEVIGNGDIEPAKKPSRGRGPKKTEEKTIEVPADEENPKPEPKKGRGRAKKVVEDDAVETKKPKGRPKKQVTQEVDDEAENQEVEPKEPKGRPRKAPSKKAVADDDEDEEEVIPKKNQRKAKKPKDSDAEDEQNEVAEKPVKKGRGRQKKQEQSDDEEVLDGADIEEKPVVKRGRGKQQNLKEDSGSEDELEVKKAPKRGIKRKVDGDEKPALKNKAETDYTSIDFSCAKKSAKGDDANFVVASWNVDGLRAWLKKDGLKYIEAENPDVLCLQETKCSQEKLPEEITEVEGYRKYWAASKKDGYAGVALFSKVMPVEVKYGIGNEDHDDEGRCITAEFKKFFVVSVYVPNAGRKLVTLPKRLEWNELFKKFVMDLDKIKPVIICGDMNVAHSEIDLANPKTNKKNAGFTQEERDGMTDFIECGFVDSYRKLYPDQEKAYTFWTYMMGARSKNVGWRLDYFLLSERLMEFVCDNVIRSAIYGSDHCPITLYLGVK